MILVGWSAARGIVRNEGGKKFGDAYGKIGVLGNRLLSYLPIYFRLNSSWRFKLSSRRLQYFRDRQNQFILVRPANHLYTNWQSFR
jgi:hypothetical protein